MLTNIAFLILGFVILIGAGDALVRGAVALSLKLGMPAFLISVTIVAFGTSAPELLISVKAVLEGVSDLALGNVVGSNIANVLLVLGVPALIAPIAGCDDDAHRNLYFMLIATAVFSAFIFMGYLPFWGGLILLGLTAVMLYDSMRTGLAQAAASGQDDIEIEELEDIDPNMASWKVWLLIGAGLVGLPLGAQLLVHNAQIIAREFGVSEAVIGLTIVAIGTSLPELATTVMAALRNKADVAIGNVIGSNFFNITAIIGVASLFGTIDVPAEILLRDIWLMLAATLILTAYVLFCRRMGRVTGAFFLVAYSAYIYVAYAAAPV